MGTGCELNFFLSAIDLTKASVQFHDNGKQGVLTLFFQLLVACDSQSSARYTHRLVNTVYRPTFLYRIHTALYNSIYTHVKVKGEGGSFLSVISHKA